MGLLGFFILLAIIIICLGLAVWFLDSIGWFAPNPTTAIPVAPPITIEQLLEEIAELRARWDPLIAALNVSPAAPTTPECDELIAIRDAVSQKIAQATDLGASATSLRPAVDALARMNVWLSQAGCE